LGRPRPEDVLLRKREDFIVGKSKHIASFYIHDFRLTVDGRVARMVSRRHTETRLVNYTPPPFSIISSISHNHISNQTVSCLLPIVE
jgi:hypothetical protein